MTFWIFIEEGQIGEGAKLKCLKILNNEVLKIKSFDKIIVIICIIESFTILKIFKQLYQRKNISQEAQLWL